jgi:hypothetical protein
MGDGAGDIPLELARSIPVPVGEIPTVVTTSGR